MVYSFVLTIGLCSCFLIHLPSEVGVAVFGRETLDVLLGADASHLAAEVHGHVVFRSVAVLEGGGHRDVSLNYLPNLIH